MGREMIYLHLYETKHKEYLDHENHIYMYAGDPALENLDFNNVTLVKEDIHSDTFLRIYLKYCNPEKDFCSHVFWMQHKASLQNFLLTDAVMNVEPTLTQFVDIIENAAYFLQLLRHPAEECDIIHVNFLNYSGSFSLKNKDAVTANNLKTHFDIEHSGDYYFTNWQLDTCLYPEARKAKHLINHDFGPNIIVAPNISTGNAIYKALMKDYICSGFVIGGKTFGILNSRSDLDKNNECVKILEQIRTNN